MPFAVRLPLPDGSSRYLPACDTTGVPETRTLPASVEAGLACGILVRVILPPPPGQPWRLAGAALRAPVSSSARHILAAQVGMEGMVTARMQLERAMQAGEAERRQAERRLALRELQEAERAAAERERMHTVFKPLNDRDWHKRTREGYRALLDAAQREAVPEGQFWQILDGERPLPAALVAAANGELKGLVGRRSEAERRAPNSGMGAVRRYQRRVATSWRMLSLARRVGGNDDLTAAAAWLAAQLG